MTDRDEKIIQHLEAIGISIIRSLKKLKVREYVMSGKYLTLAQTHVNECVKLVRNEKNGGKPNAS